VREQHLKVFPLHRNKLFAQEFAMRLRAPATLHESAFFPHFMIRGAKRATAFVTTLLVMLGLSSISQSAEAQTYSLLYSFPSHTSGYGPGALLNVNGTLYGTTASGGGASLGTVFKVTAAGAERNLYTFSTRANGNQPNGTLVRDAAGNLYGTTAFGGDLTCTLQINQKGCGVVYKLTPTGQQTVLHAFAGGSDGAGPFLGLVADASGNLYGMTNSGGGACAGGAFCGTVFKITPSGTETILHAFSGGADGGGTGYYGAALVIDAKGNLYGTTGAGGNLNCDRTGYGCGVVFKMDPSGKETVLYAFTGGADGVGPSGLVADPKGNLYGATSEGGAGFGTVFKLSPTRVLTVLYTFQIGDSLGGGASTLVLDSVGNLYGTTLEGGTDQVGTIFEVSSQGVYTLLHFFSGTAIDGEFPTAGMVHDNAGNLYGTTSGGGGGGCSLGCGAVFKFTP
jgi:uncharacterized repeat protein (TIGR03803 family)